MVELETITNATQYATAYLDGKAVATLQRRRVYEDGPAWKVYAADGTLLFQTWIKWAPSYFARRIENALATRAC